MITRCKGCDVVLTQHEIIDNEEICDICLEYGLGRPEEEDLLRPWEEAKVVKSDTYN